MYFRVSVASLTRCSLEFGIRFFSYIFLSLDIHRFHRLNGRYETFLSLKILLFVFCRCHNIFLQVIKLSLKSTRFTSWQFINMLACCFFFRYFLLLLFCFSLDVFIFDGENEYTRFHVFSIERRKKEAAHFIRILLNGQMNVSFISSFSC